MEMDDHDQAIYDQALAAADRSRKFRSLRAIVAALCMALVLAVAAGFYSIHRTERSACRQTQQNRDAIRNLAQEELMTAPIDPSLSPEVLAQIVSSRENHRRNIEKFLAENNKLQC